MNKYIKYIIAQLGERQAEDLKVLVSNPKNWCEF